jgi:hypothetical protein
MAAPKRLPCFDFPAGFRIVAECMSMLDRTSVEISIPQAKCGRSFDR